MCLTFFNVLATPLEERGGRVLNLFASFSMTLYPVLSTGSAKERSITEKLLTGR